MDTFDIIDNFLLQVLFPTIGIYLLIFLGGTTYYSMRLANIVGFSVLFITLAFYFIPLFNYGVFGMKDYMYIKNNLSETKFEEFKKKSKELETLKIVFSNQIKDDIFTKKVKRDIERISNYKVKKDSEEETLKLLYTDDDEYKKLEEIMSKEEFEKFNRTMLELERRAKKYLIEE